MVKKTLPKPIELPMKFDIKVGVERFGEQPFSGAVANMIFYPRNLSQEEIELDAQLKNVDDGILIKRDENNQDYEFPFSGADYNVVNITGANFSACSVVEDKEIQAVPFPLYKTVTCNEAKLICEKFGGEVPPYNFETKADLTRLLPDQRRFWVSNSMVPNTRCGVALILPNNKFALRRTRDPVHDMACLINKRKLFKFKVTEYLGHNFYLTKPSKFIFETGNGRTRMKIIDEGSVKKIAIYSNLNQKIFYESHTKELSEIHLGRFQWTNLIPPLEVGQQFTAILSTCTPDQFTCTSGHCINISLICNYESNCRDRSDEENCDYTKKPTEHYDKRLSPAPNKNDQEPFDVSLFMERVNQIGMEDSIMQLTLTLTASWSDNRLSFNNLLSPPELSLIPEEETLTFWHPQISFTTAKSESKYVFHLDKSPGKFYALPKEMGQFVIRDGYESKNYFAILIVKQFYQIMQ